MKPIFVIALSALLNLLLVNADFSQGLTGWRAGDGWTSANGVAVFDWTNTTDSQFPTGGDLCSELYVVPPDTGRLHGAMDFRTRWNEAKGRALFGVEWYDEDRVRLETNMYDTSEGKPVKQWQSAQFLANPPPDGAKFVAFCVRARAYYGQRFLIKVDNAELQ